jgi:hypothetical protein
VYTNADSLFNKLGELQTLISEKKYDTIAITEIFPKNQNLDYNDNLWNIPGYTFHYPTQKVFTARGCVIYTKVTLKAYHIESRVMDCIEHLQIGIKTTDEPNLLVSCIYRSPSANNDACIGELSEILNRKKFHNTKFDCILHMGDFNFREINWHSQNTSIGSDHMATKFLDTVMDSFLIQNVKHPTTFFVDLEERITQVYWTYR